jgi:hypothetical protein
MPFKPDGNTYYIAAPRKGSEESWYLGKTYDKGAGRYRWCATDQDHGQSYVSKTWANHALLFAQRLLPEYDWEIVIQ